ncbi:ester cyclase [Nitrosopumilus sp.]|uniref:ester cyclase n=1 Tax=Nitrosopumilus sp. TaxID=2024843 RepID=UPI00292F7BD2|nr:ester cyclase [Nitrosopumilus sp.]
MNSLSFIVLIPLILSIGIASSLQFDIVSDADALKSKGTSLPEVGSKKVCGDTLCSELSEAQKKQHHDKKDKDEQIESKTKSDAIKTYEDPAQEITALKTQIAKLQEKIDKYETEQITVQANLEMFDFMDFVAFNNQDWELVSTTHSHDVKVIYANGHQTDNFEDHVPDMQMVFVYAPDTQIISHPIAFGQGEWTAGTGVVEGTFTEPMPLPDDTFIEPTGNKFNYTMVTIAKWEDGIITEEYLFWDNAEIMKQLGITLESGLDKDQDQ